MKEGIFYITTTLPYVNAEPHIGFALELVQADSMARFRRAQGDEVFFNTGTDEHGLKIYRKAQEAGKDPQTYVDELSQRFKELNRALNLSDANFIKTTDPNHIQAAQEFWKLCEQNGDIEKKLYETKYCVGCELEKTDSELVDGRCPLHPNLEIEVIKEENYFFKFSKYQDRLLELYQERPDFVVPESRLKEIKNFIQKGLNDFSISRLKEKMPWGVPVPGDEDHVMYVWFDALVNYISAAGWPEDKEKFAKWWPVVQVAGKDQTRQQAAMWQAMLMSAGLAPSKKIFIHGFVTADGQKMSKSLGNVIDPFALVEKYGSDTLRYYLLRDIASDEDGDFSEERLRERYQADLANGLGNFASRVSTLAEKTESFDGLEADMEIKDRIEETVRQAAVSAERFKLHESVASIWKLISFGDGYVNEHKPWETNNRQTIFNLVVLLDAVANLVEPIVPEAAGKIKAVFTMKKGKIAKVRKVENLFPRLDA
ncbi:MAG: methionine--tRNA ligase [bacterium]|nr:methionine--tRNA ligase [bacterium]